MATNAENGGVFAEEDAGDLELFYWDVGMSTRELAEEFGTTQTTVIKTMERFGIERREAGGADGRDTPWRDGDALENVYLSGEEGGKGEPMSQSAVAEKMGCSSATVRRWLERHGIERRDPDWRTAE